MSDPSTLSTTLDRNYDDYYYFPIITFWVEGTLFRVPGHHFIQQSEVFRDMFELPVSNNTLPDGSSDEQPLRLEGVRKVDFKELLRAMFPTLIRLQSTEIFTVSQWTSILRLSALWQMDYLKQSAIQALPRLNGSRWEWTALLDLSVERGLSEARKIAIPMLTPMLSCPFDMIAMARKYQVKSWLQTGLQALVQRQDLLSEAYEESLGWRTIVKLCRLREDALRRGHYGYYSRLTIEGEFQDELKELGD